MYSSKSGQQLECMVAQAIEKENKFWRPLELTGTSTKLGASVTYEHRSDIIEWQSQVALKFQFYPEAQALAVSILDKFLTCVKVQTKYLKCVAVTCLYIASKMTEEDEIVPHISDLVVQSSANCSTDDIVRMEGLILNKLDWNVNLVTPLHFLQVFHAILLTDHPDLLSSVCHMTAERQLAFLTHKLQLCMMSKDCAQWCPSIIAVSLLSLELEQFRPDWFPLTLSLLKLIQRDNFSELIACRENLSSHLLQIVAAARAERAEICRQQKRTRCHTNVRSKRKMTEPPVDQDDLYSSIKGLYTEGGIGSSVEHSANMAATLGNED